MRKLPILPAILAALLVGGHAVAQDSISDVISDPAVRLGRPADRARVVAKIAAIENTRRQNARAKAARLGLSLRSQSRNGRIQEIADFVGDEPVYLTTHNANSAISTGANVLRTSPYSLTGGGVTIGLWDGGSGRSGHQEVGGRLTVKDGAASIDHATHVGGTLIASGIVASARGMAGSATVDSYDWNSDTTEMTSRGATYAGEPGKIYLSNHSYGFIGGWNYVNNGTRVWEWNGAGTGNASIEDDFGRYNTYARDNDTLAFNAPYYLIFRSAGNDRTDNPGAGQTVSLSPGGASVVTYDPAMHPAGDGLYRGGFETISFNAVAKNVITIGSVSDAVTGGARDPAKAFSSSFSSWGPTDDGRIKPDVVANGDGLYSSLNADNAAYGTYSGTSMASPNATGSAALLIQQFGSLFPGQAMRAATLKGLLIHTADDRGNPGPDYKYGWGLVNVKAAADLIRDQFDFPAKQRMTESQLNSGALLRTQSFVWDGVSPISATLSWTDPAAGALTASDSRSARLVNNLNLKITAPDGSEHFPFVMPFVGNWSQSSMDAPAVTGVNNTDNVEQVRIAVPPMPGTYRVDVSAGGTLVNNSQNYSLLISGSSTDAPPPPPLTLAAISPASGISGTVTVDVTGTGFQTATALRLKRVGQADIAATGIQLIGGALRGQFDLTAAASGAWDVMAANPFGETATLAGGFTVVGAIWSENFDGPVSGWVSQATTGSNSWALVTTLSHTPAKAYFASGPSSKSTTTLTSPGIPIPAGASALQLKFWQNFNLQSTRDAGRMEFSLNGGAWFDIEDAGSGAAFASNGYNSTVSSSGSSSSRNEFAGRRAWSGNSNGFAETIVNLTDTARYAGSSLRIRWLIATNSSTPSAGWYLDSMALLGGGNLANSSPAIASAPISSTPETVTDPDGTVYRIVRAASADLSVLATDDAGEAALTYTWSVTSGPATPVFFSQNGTHAARDTTINLEATGDYQLRVTVRDAEGLTVTAPLYLRVLQAPSGIIVSPAAITLAVGATQPFGATVIDQFSMAMATQPASFTWSASGGGGIDSTGFFTATSVGGPFVVTAANGGFSNTAGVTVTPAPASVILGNLEQIYSGSPLAIGVITDPPNLAVAVTYAGSPTAPTAAGSYAVEATVTDPNYQGSATGTLVIGKATADIALGDLALIYDGAPKAATATTSPAGLAISLAYEGSPTPPTAAGSYEVTATLDDLNYQGSATDTLVIGKGTADIALEDLASIYDGSPKAATATTIPAGLAVSLAYAGSPTPPTNAGSYEVTATVDDANYQGSGTGTLVIDKATANIALTDIASIYDGSPKAATAATTPAGLAISLAYAGSPTPPTAAGSYEVTATVNDANYQGSAIGTLVIAKAMADIALTDLAPIYDGSPKATTATTTPAGLAVSLAYAGSPTPPTDAGSYEVTATVEDGNYQGSVIGALVIEKAVAVIELSTLAPIYDGSPKAATAATTPAGLAVSLAYDGSPTLPTAAGSYEVTATVDDGNYQGFVTGTLVISKAMADIALTDLAPIYDGSPIAVTPTTTPAGLAVSLAYDGSPTPPTDAGSYEVTATLDDANYQGSATGTLVIGKAMADIALTDLAPNYDGSPKAATATTTPAGLAVSLAYDGSPTPPTAAGSYEVTASVDDPNYQGSATGMLVIEKAVAVIEFSTLAPIYDGTPKAATATTTPGGLAVSLAYDGSPTPPNAAGIYEITATLDDANYQGFATATLVISANFASWTADHFSDVERAAGLAESTADPDADDLTNFAEYALGTDPRQFTPPLAAVLGENGLSLTFTRPADLPDVIYAAEASDDLDGWQDVPLEVLEPGATETVRALDPPAAGIRLHRFIRLRFERPGEIPPP